MTNDYDDPNEIVEGPFGGWVFNNAYSGVIFRMDLHRTERGVVCWDWREATPESEGYFNNYRRCEVYPTRVEALVGLSARYERRVKRSEAFIAKIDRAVILGTAEAAHEVR